MPIDGRDNFTYLSYSAGVAAVSASNATFTGTVRITGGPNITVGTDASGITISGAAGGGGGGALSAIQGSNATYTSGTVVLTGSNAATVRSTTGQALVIDVPTQTAQTQNLHNVTLSGNTAGAMAQVSSGTMTIAGGNNITLSQAGNAITISGPNTSAQQTGISSIGASNTTYTSGGITFTGSNAVTVRSTTGQGIVIDAPVQTVQTQGVLSAGVSNVGNTAGNTTVNSGQRLVFAGAGAATLSQATGAGSTTISVSVPTQTAQTGISSIGASNTTYTSGGITFTGSNAVTVRSTTGQGIVIDAPTQTVQTQNVHNLTISGNTAGAGAAVSSGTLTLAGGNNITLSQAGNAITISGAAAGGVQTGISSIAVSDSTYTSGSVQFLGSGAAVVRSTTGQGVLISVPAQTAQTGISGIAASNATYTSGTVTITGVANITVSSNTGQRIDLSVAAGATATGNLGAIAGSNATYTSGTVTITGVGGGVTVSSNTGQRIDISVAAPVAQTVQTQNVVVPAASNTTYTSGTYTITGVGGGVTVSSNTGQRIDISVAAPVAQTVQTQNLHNVTLSGNTAGVMAHISSGTLTLAGGNNITLSQNGNAVTISGAAGGGGNFSAGVSNLGNSAGSTGITGTRLVLVGTNNITLSQSTDANGGTVSISGGAGGGGGNFSAGVSDAGNTAGATGLTGTQLVLVGSNNITLSQTTGANGATVTISGLPTPTLSYYDILGDMKGSATSQWRAPATANGTWFFFPINSPMDVFPGNMTASTIRMDMSGSNTVTTASTGSWTLSMSMAIYTLNGSTLSLLNSGSTSMGSGAANASNSSLYHGFRWLTMHSSQFSVAPVFTRDEYWGAIAFRSSGEAKLMSMLGGQFAAVGSANRSGFLGVGSSTGSSTMIEYPFLGMYTATSTAPPTSVTKGQIARANNTGSVNFIPHILFDNVGLND